MLISLPILRNFIFREIFEQKNHKSASFPPSWILADMQVTS
jgi:hypothetical protein